MRSAVKRLLVALSLASTVGLGPVPESIDPAAATPALPTYAAPLCGVPDPASVSAPAQPLPQGAVHVVAQGFSASALAVSGSTLYVLDKETSTIRIMTLDGTLLHSFTTPWGFSSPSIAVDETGAMYVGRWPAGLVKLAPDGTELWTVGDTDVKSVFSIGSGSSFRVGTTASGVAGSTLYTADGVPAGSSPISGTAFSSTSDGGVVATDGRYVRRYNAAGTELARFGDPGGVGDQQFTGGPYHFFQQGGAAEGPGGRLYVADATRGIHGTTSEGYYRGAVDDLTVGFVTERAWMVPAGDRLYYTAGGRFNGNQNVSWISFADLDALVTAPRFPNPVLGFGAGLKSFAPGQYFRQGTTPFVIATFDGWWATRASGLSLQYTVRDRVQTVNQVPVASTTVPLPVSPQGATVPLTLPPTRPGAYEVDARLIDGSGAVVGATCYRYAVAGPGHQLDFGTLPPGTDFGGPHPRRGVALADQLGIGALRATVEWNRLLPAGFDGPMDFSAYEAPFAAAATEAASRGVSFFVQVGSGLAMEQTLVATGTWGARVQELVQHFDQLGIEVEAWEAWNEPNNNFGGTPQEYVDKVLRPFFQAVRAGDPDSKVIGGTVLGMDLYYFDAIGQAGAYQLMDIVGMHPYTGHNRAWEEQGIPQNVRDLRTILGRYGAQSMPLWNTESAWWSDGPGNYFSQADKAARALLWSRALGIERWSYLLLEAGYGDFGLTYSFIQAAIQPDYVKAAALGTMTTEALTATRPFLGMIDTGIPHAFAASFGSVPGGSDTVIAAWTDDIDVDAALTVSGPGSSVAIAVTDVLGAPSTLNLVPGQPSPIALNGSPVYLKVPAGAQLTVGPAGGYTANLAAASAGATATATSATSTNGAARAIDGLPTARLARTSDLDGAEGGNLNGLPAWASAPGDSAPVLTVSLPAPTEINRVVVLSHSNGSISPSLRNFTVEVRDGGGTWHQVAAVQDQFFDRGTHLTFAARQVTGVRVRVTAVNYGGYTGGTPSWFWPMDAASQSNPSEVWYGPAAVYELEAYGPGSGPPPPPPPQPPAAPTNLTATAVSTTRVNLAWTGSSGATSYKVERSTDGVTFAPLVSGITTTSHADLTASPGTTYHYRVRATNAGGDSAPSNVASATTPSQTTLAAPTNLSASRVTGSQARLSWTGSVGATSYTVERSTNGTSFVPVATGLTSTTYTDVALTANTTYYYRVRAVSGSTVSEPSNVVQVRTKRK